MIYESSKSDENERDPFALSQDDLAILSGDKSPLIDMTLTSLTLEDARYRAAQWYCDISGRPEEREEAELGEIDTYDPNFDC